jgi:hypothetical protein
MLGFVSVWLCLWFTVSCLSVCVHIIFSPVSSLFLFCFCSMSSYNLVATKDFGQRIKFRHIFGIWNRRLCWVGAEPFIGWRLVIFRYHGQNSPPPIDDLEETDADVTTTEPRRLEYPCLGFLDRIFRAGSMGCTFCEMCGTRSKAISTLARLNRKPQGKRSDLIGSETIGLSKPRIP